MAEIQTIIGSLPVCRGEYDAGVSYFRDNQVTMYGSTFQSIADDNVGYPPAEERDDGKVYAINADKWIIVANALAAYNAGKRIDDLAENTEIKDEDGAVVKTPFRYIQNEEFIFAKVDNEDKLLFGIQWDGTPVFGKTSAVEDRLLSQVTLLAERVAIIMGDEDTTNVIDTMNELKKFFADIENTETLTGILANLDNVAKNLDKTTIKDEEGNVQDTPFRLIENEEFIMAVVDSEDKVLFGIYRATGKPYYPQNDMYHISQSEEFLWAILDAANHPLLGIQQDGTCWAAKAQWLDDIKAIKNVLSSIDETLKTFQQKEDGKGLINLDVADSFFYISNDEYIIAVVDAEGRILAGIKYDGKPYFPNHEMYSVITNEEWLYAIIDAENKVLGGFRAYDGHMIVGGIDISDFIANAIIDVADIKKRIAHLSTIENDEYLSVETDADGKVLGYTAPDGSHYLYKVKSETIDAKVDKKEGKSLIDVDVADAYSAIEDPEGRTEITIDADGKVISYRDQEGKKHEHDMEVTNLDVSNLNLKGNSINDISDALKANGFKLDSPSDFSKKSEASVPYPAIPPIINIISENGFPMSKTANFKGYFEYYDNFGNYFKKPAVFNAQGNSSLSYGFPKTNLAVDLLANEANDSDSFSLKIGNWVPQDSFHFKAYYTDAFKCVNLASYDLNIQMWNTMEYSSNRPWKKYLLSEDDKKGSLYKKLDILNSYSSDPRCVPDGFPVMLLLNSKFYGLYQMQIKKHRDNYAMNKKNPLHIQLDGNVGSNELFGKIDWTKFEIRNPKSLICSDGSKYDGDNPSEITGDVLVDKNTSQVKKSIERFAACVNVFKKAVADSKSKEEIQELISSYLDVDYTIDYILETNIVQNYDSRRKNVQWCTWNGTIWVPCPYDQDQSFKGTSSGFMIDINLGIGVIQESEELPFYWVYTYFIEQVKLRYKYLVSNGIFTKDNLFKTFIERVNQIGEKNYSLEYKKWNESPCHRSSNVNTEYWVPTFKFYGRIAYGGYYSTTEYKEGDYCYVGENVYRCKKACKNIPVSNTEYWENVTYDNTKTYSIGEYCAYGERDFCIFKAIKETTGKPPLTKLYEYYPKIMGFSDSIYRIESFCKKVIDFFNNKLV